MAGVLRQRRRHVFVLGVLLVLGAVVTVLAAVSSPPVDEALYRWARELDVPLPWDLLGDVRSVPVVLAVALPVLLAWRCRVALLGTALAVASGVGLGLLLQLVASRPRPYDSALSGQDSYPSVVLLVLALLLTTYPLWLPRPAAAVRDPAGRSPLVTAGVIAVPATVVLLSGLQEVHVAERWPLDVIGALVVGGFVGTVLRIAVETPTLHAGCRECPWQWAESYLEPEPARQHGGASHPLYRLAVLWTLALVVVFGYLFWTRGVPRLPESGVVGTGLEVPLNLGLLGLLCVGMLLAARWHVVGAVVVAFAATMLGFAASAHYYPSTAFLVAAAAFVPALLLWVQWHRVASLRAVTAVATVTAVVLGVTAYFASVNYTYYWGPTHPTSATPALDDGVVAWMWSGAVTPTSVTVNARTADPADAVRLVVGRGPRLAGAVRSAVVTSTSGGQQVVSLTVDGLRPDTAYRYALEVDGTLATERTGRFRTFPRGPASFTFVVGADARTGSNGMVFDAIRRVRPLLYLNVGDFFYGDVERDNPDLYRVQYDANLTAPAQEALYAAAPFAYTWGDHDFGGNDADSTATGKPAAMEVFRQYVPHYPLRGGPQAPIFQAFTIGDVRFVLTDNRSQRDPVATQPRGMLGARQLAWLRDELSRADDYGLVVWANADPWVGRADPTSDTWQGCAEERADIADMIAELEVDNLFMVSGDAHMLAWDDGSHTDYARTGSAAFPLLQAAALDRKPSVKGGPYSGPVLPGGGQFGTVEVRDDGETVQVTAQGRDYRGEVLFTKTFTRTR
jgi:phosphodiesterase/alkaline phosphatase D-like protein